MCQSVISPSSVSPGIQPAGTASGATQLLLITSGNGKERVHCAVPLLFHIFVASTGFAEHWIIQGQACHCHLPITNGTGLYSEQSEG